MKRLMQSMNMRKWLRDSVADVGIDEELLRRSRIARIGKRTIQASVVMHIMAPLLVIIAMFALAAVPALAQGPGGPIFGGNDQTVGNGVREAVKWGRNMLFLLGVAFVIWGIINFAIEKSYMKQILGAVGCFGFGGIAALAQSFSQGQAVNIDTTLQ